ncbi:MAG: hypothetical protein OQL18_00515 [Deltaproteobacteria bacterium]|nr:hypothetical protein [Deltaproteobacteria bacterium]
MTRFEVNQIIMPLYMDSAQMYLQLSIGALALTIIFKEKILGEKNGINVELYLIVSWLLFLLTIGFSAFYQYLAVKFLDSVSDVPGKIQYFESLVRAPGKIYGLMLLSFFSAAVLFVLNALKQIVGKNSS